jgi:hypothetical protein
MGTSSNNRKVQVQQLKNTDHEYTTQQVKIQNLCETIQAWYNDTTVKSKTKLQPRRPDCIPNAPIFPRRRVCGANTG